MVKTPGRGGFPGLYLSAPAATLRIDGKEVLPVDALAVLDPCGGIRIDFSEPLTLDEGLHNIELTLHYRSKREWFGGVKGPCVRLYWSSEHFLREVIPAKHLAH
jgi:hypothetical protein